ncbi:hypothetical protein AVEN_43418-1 [Araneus ventricosus]|uniref:CCHC-type domain-containing protein n=1 Tax=Araneus ventricosus TaxID=182803 RepID=A0A4Y2N0U5_ARAVE|nr:hypothetical protein AVEN_43418-1 [Araneus ventricosus]
MRKTDLWRTDSNVPLCYHCGRPGHVLRYCRERRQIFADSRATRTFNPDEMQILNRHKALKIATRSRLPPVSGATRLALDVPATADNHSHLYAAPAFLHVDPMRKTNSGDLCRR